MYDCAHSKMEFQEISVRKCLRRDVRARRALALYQSRSISIYLCPRLATVQVSRERKFPSSLTRKLSRIIVTTGGESRGEHPDKYSISGSVTACTFPIHDRHFHFDPAGSFPAGRGILRITFWAATFPMRTTRFRADRRMKNDMFPLLRLSRRPMYCGFSLGKWDVWKPKRFSIFVAVKIVYGTIWYQFTKNIKMFMNYHLYRFVFLTIARKLFISYELCVYGRNCEFHCMNTKCVTKMLYFLCLFDDFICTRCSHHRITFEFLDCLDLRNTQINWKVHNFLSKIIGFFLFNKLICFWQKSCTKCKIVPTTSLKMHPFNL